MPLLTNAGRNGQRSSSLQQKPTLQEGCSSKMTDSRAWQQTRGHRRNKQHTSARVHSANQTANRNNKDVSSPTDACNIVPIVSISNSIAAGTEALTDANIEPAHGICAKRATSKSPSSLTSTVNACGTLHRAHGNSPRNARAYTRPFIGAVLSICGKRGASEVEHTEPMEGPSIMERAARLSLVNNEPSRLQLLHHSEVSRSTSTLHGEDDQQKSTDVERSSTKYREIERLRRDLASSHSRIAELQKHRQVQPRDQVVPHGFFDIADTSSDSDVIRAIQRLNAEVQQHATYMADCLVQELGFKNVETEMTEEQMAVAQTVSGYIGPALANALESRPQEIPLLLQIAFQAYLTAMLGQTASAWAIDAGHSASIDGIYQQLRGAEAQATSGRWRSLARFHNLHNGLNNPESLIKKVVVDLSDILLVAGCTAPQPDIQSKITSDFKERIALLVELALRLNKTFDEVISSDFEVLLAPPGDRFEGTNMEETEGDRAGGQEGLTVLCATHLGLIKWAPEGSLWEKGMKRKIIVLKVKVLLESLLDAED